MLPDLIQLGQLTVAFTPHANLKEFFRAVILKSQKYCLK